MKRWPGTWICTFVLLIILPVPAALGVSLSIDGQPRTFLPEAYLDPNTAMMPLRPVIECLGGEVSWNAADAGISCRLNGQELSFHLNDRFMEHSGQKMLMPAAACLCGGVVFVPARLPLETLGLTVGWEEQGLAITSGSPAALPAAEAEPASSPSFCLSDTSAAQGQILMLWMSGCRDSDRIEFTIGMPGVKSAFYDYGDKKLKLIGVASDTPPGAYPYHATLERGAMRLVDVSGCLQVREGGFEEQRLWVDDSLAGLLDSEQAAHDQLVVAQALSQTEPRPLWQDSFIQPCEGRITTLYGTYRYVNGQSPYQHSGLDIAADYGVPVKASNNGVTVLAAPLYVTGNTVILDHGCGVFSMYYHLQDMYTAPGDTVERGQTIGAVGSTGFSTGPHLHWNMGIDETPLNPYGFLGSDLLSLLGPVPAP